MSSLGSPTDHPSLQTTAPACLEQKAIACLLGGAAGDALGYAVEFFDEPRIRQLYGPLGICTYDLENGIALVSDDTQMSLFTGAGILDALDRHPQLADAFGNPGARLEAAGGQPMLDLINEGVWNAYQDWLTTQTRSWKPGSGGVCRLLNNPALFSTRAPGNTCLHALHGRRPGSLQHPINDSKGCGGVMRVAPLAAALCTRMPVPEAAKAGAMAAALTHGHPLGWLPGAYLVCLLGLLMTTDLSIIEAARQSSGWIQTLFSSWDAPVPEALEVFLDLMDQAMVLAAGPQTDLACIHQLGEGWTGEEAMAIALFCALRHPHDFSAALRAAVNHRGDSDSTGAVTGNIMGAALGQVPEEWLDGLELKEELTGMAKALCAASPALYAEAFPSSFYTGPSF